MNEIIQIPFEINRKTIERLTDSELSLEVYYQWSLNDAKDNIQVTAVTEIFFLR